MSGLTKALHHLAIEPAQKRSPALSLFRISQILHERARGRYDHSLVRAVSAIHPKVKLPPSRLTNGNAIAKTLDALNQRGWDILPWRLGAQDIDEIRRFAFSTPACAVDPSETISFTESDIPQDQPRYSWRMSDLIRVPAVQRIAADSAWYDIAQNYLGCRPILTSITLWLDPAYKGGYEAHVYHYDNDGPKFLKFFFYLNDLDARTGAHSYIERSHGHMKPRQFAFAKRYERDDLLNFYGAEREITFAAPAGTILAEDTAGFHKGTTPQSGYRMLMQMQFAVVDIPHIEEFALTIAKAHIDDLHPAIQRIANKFYN